MKDDNYAVIQGWMINRLHLSGTELMVFAIIHGFTQGENGDGFAGGISYLTEWTGTTSRTVITILQRLEEKGLIRRETMATKTGKKSKIFSTVEGEMISPPSQKSGEDSENISPPIVKIFHEDGENISHKNINIDSTSNEVEKREREGRAKRFTPPTLDEVRAYVRERGNKIDPETFMNYYESIGWKVGKVGMKNWKAAVIVWERREAKAQEPKTPKGTFYQFEQRTYTEEEEKEIEKKLLRKGRNR